NPYSWPANIHSFVKAARGARFTTTSAIDAARKAPQTRRRLRAVNPASASLVVLAIRGSPASWEPSSAVRSLAPARNPIASTPRERRPCYEHGHAVLFIFCDGSSRSRTVAVVVLQSPGQPRTQCPLERGDTQEFLGGRSERLEFLFEIAHIDPQSHVTSQLPARVDAVADQRAVEVGQVLVL